MARRKTGQSHSSRLGDSNRRWADQRDQTGHRQATTVFRLPVPPGFKRTQSSDALRKLRSETGPSRGKDCGGKKNFGYEVSSISWSRHLGSRHGANRLFSSAISSRSKTRNYKTPTRQVLLRNQQ